MIAPRNNQPKDNNRIETDKVKNEVADAIIKLIADGADEIPDALMDQTSGKALRNRLYFALQTDSETNVYISAGTVAGYDKTGELEDNIDGFVNVLLPNNCGEVMEQTFAFDEETSAEEAAKILYAAGFQFSEKLQNEFEKGLTERVKKAIGLSNDFNNKSDKQKEPTKTEDKNDKKDNKPPKGPNNNGGFGGGHWGGGGGCMGGGGFRGF